MIVKPLQLRDIWSAEIVKHDGVAPIEGLSWMSRATLDIIGLAGKIILSVHNHIDVINAKPPAFNYQFNALAGDPEKNELMKSFSTIFKAGQKPSVIPMLKAMYPSLRFLVCINICSSSFLLSNLLHGITVWTK